MTNIQPPAIDASTNNKKPLSADFIAGIAISGLLIPEAIAYSNIAGMPPAMGVVALLCGLLVYGLFGSSRFAIVSATSSSAAVLGAAVAMLGTADLLVKISIGIGLTLLAGSFLCLAGAAKLGHITDFIAKPVMRGFAFGLSLVIIIKELPKVLQIAVAQSDIFHIGQALLSHAAQTNIYSLIIGLVALGLLFALARFKRLPGTLIVIIASLLLQHWVNLSAHGVQLVGAIDLQLQAPQLPHFTRAEWLRLLEMAVPLALIIYAESYSSIQTYAIKHGDQVQTNRDLLALGGSNVLSALLRGMPVGAGFSATTANETFGAQSRYAALIAAVVCGLLAWLFLPQLAKIPEAVLAAIVIYAVSHGLNPAPFHRYFFLQRDRLVFLASIVLVLALGVLDGLLASIGISIIMMLRRWGQISISQLGQLHNSHDFVSLSQHPDAQCIQGIRIIRPEEPLFFANIGQFIQQCLMQQQTAPQPLIISLDETPDMDSTTVEAFIQLAQTAQSLSWNIVLARLKPDAMAILQRAGVQNAQLQLTDLSVDDAVNMVENMTTAVALK